MKFEIMGKFLSVEKLRVFAKKVEIIRVDGFLRNRVSIKTCNLKNKDGLCLMWQ
jgi:hypothetical protein